MATERELIEQRNTIVQQLRTMLTDAGPTGLSGEQEANYDKMHADMTALEEQVKAIRKTQERAFALEEREARLNSESQTKPVAKQIAVSGGVTGKAMSRAATPEYAAEFTHWLRTGEQGREMRALQSDVAVAGGFTIAAEQFVADLIAGVNDDLVIRQLASIYTLDRAQQLTFPTRSADLADATWGTELQVATADTALTVGQRNLIPHPLTAQILVSKLLFQQSRIDIDAFVRERFVYKFGVTMEKAYMEGLGAGQPLGLFIGSANGLSTNRDVTTSASSANPTALNLISTFYSLKPQYRRNATWVFHRTWLSGIRKLQDSQNNFIWTPAGFGFAQGMTVGHPDMLLGRPYYESEYAPSVVTAGGSSGVGVSSSGYFALVGDLKRGYYIADAVDLGINRYDQINAATNQDTFIGLFQTDGAPVLEEALARARSSTA